MCQRLSNLAKDPRSLGMSLARFAPARSMTIHVRTRDDHRGGDRRRRCGFGGQPCREHRGEHVRSRDRHASPPTPQRRWKAPAPLPRATFRFQSGAETRRFADRDQRAPVNVRRKQRDVSKPSRHASSIPSVRDPRRRRLRTPRSPHRRGPTRGTMCQRISNLDNDPRSLGMSLARFAPARSTCATRDDHRSGDRRRRYGFGGQPCREHRAEHVRSRDRHASPPTPQRRCQAPAPLPRFTFRFQSRAETRRFADRDQRAPVNVRRKQRDVRVLWRHDARACLNCDHRVAAKCGDRRRHDACGGDAPCATPRRPPSWRPPAALWIWWTAVPRTSRRTRALA